MDIQSVTWAYRDGVYQVDVLRQGLVHERHDVRLTDLQDLLTRLGVEHDPIAPGTSGEVVYTAGGDTLQYAEPAEDTFMRLQSV